MTFTNGDHGPITIAEAAREIDHTGDFCLSVSDIVTLIEIYGNVRFAQGQVASYKEVKK